MKKIYRLHHKRVAFGVLAGVAEYLRIDVVVVRVLFLIGLIVTGLFPLVIIYLVAFLLFPAKYDDVIG